MRRALPLLLLLAACEPRRDPRAIERVLSAKTIDLEALEDLLRVEEGALRLVRPDVDPVRTSPPEGDWFLENAGRRPVWLRRDELRVRVDLDGLVPLKTPEVSWGGRRIVVPPRPSFDPAVWMLLERGARVRLPLESSVSDPGDYLLRVLLWDHGRDLRRDAESFNAGTVLASTGRQELVDVSTSFLLLPPLDWPGAPWHDEHPIDPAPLPDGRFEIVTLREAAFVSTMPMPIEGFVVTDRGDFVFRGFPTPEEDDEAAASDAVRHRTVYRLPVKLDAGCYRILVRTDEAESFFSAHLHRCQAPRGAASRWVPFRVE